MALRINPWLGEQARRMRNNQTAPEQMLWRHLRRSQLEGCKFRRQTVIEPYICDFFSPSKGLVVEVDGDTHVRIADASRDQQLTQKGFEVLRFTTCEVKDNLEGVFERILAAVRELPDRFTHPLTPSLERDGESS